MKKALALLFISSMLILTACSGSSGDSAALQKELSDLKAAQETLAAEKEAAESALTEANAAKEDLQTQLDQAKKDVATAEEELSSAKADLEKAQSDLKTVTEEYASYKEKMSEYEGLSEAEAEARQIEADRIKAEEEAAAAQKAEEERLAAEEAAREAEEKAKQGYDTGITFDQLARTPDDYKGQKVKFSGEVIQVLESETEIDLRIAVDGDYSKVILVYYVPNIVSSRVLEDDYITIYGVSQGLYTYESTMGGNITVPLISVDKIDQ